MDILNWKAKQTMNPLGILLFSGKESRRNTRLAESENICPLVPGIQTLPSNIMTKVWNTVPGLQTATKLGSVKTLVKKWAKSIPQ